MTEEQIKEVMRLCDRLAADMQKAVLGASICARAELETYLRTIGEPENTFPLNPNGASKWAHLQKHDGAEAIGVVFRTGSGSVGSLVDGRVVWADWLAHPNGSKPESVNAELLEFAQEVRRTGDTRLANMAIAAIARAESSIETPAKVSPCAGHAAQLDADDLVGLRGCNSRHGGMRAVDPCGYRMRTTDPGCTGCVERDEDQPAEAGD